MQNTYEESFNGRLRDECLNESCFANLADAPDDRAVAARLQRGAVARGPRRSNPPRACERAAVESTFISSYRPDITNGPVLGCLKNFTGSPV